MTATTRKSNNLSRTRTPAQKEYSRLKRLESQPVVHEIFVQAIAHASNDEFWRTKLLQASRGKFPKNFFLRKTAICFKNNRNEIIREELGSTSLDVYKTFTRFLRKHGHLHSDIDVEINNNTRHNEPEKKNTRGVLDVEIYEYLNLCKESWDLPAEVFASYQRCVFMLVRLQGKKCIHYSEGSIDYFNGIVYDEDTGLYEIESKALETLLNTKKSSEPICSKPILYSHYKSKEEDFEDVLKNLQKTRKEMSLNDVLDMAAIDT